MLDIFYPITGTQTSLPFYLNGIGTGDPECRIEREKGLDSHLFLFTSDGQGMLTVDNNSYAQRRGCMFYMAPGIPHEYHPIIGSGWNISWLTFRGSCLKDIMKKLGYSGFERSSEADLSLCQKIFKKIMAAVKDPVKGAEKASVLLYEFIVNAAEVLLASSKDKSGLGSVADPAIIHINNNYAQDITLETLANVSGVSVQHFCRVFKAKTGMRPMEYLAKKRIAEAKLLLLNTGESIGYIAASVGYSDQNYFGMVFKKYEGITPSEYRKQRGLMIL